MSPKNAPSGASLALTLIALFFALATRARAEEETILRPIIEVEQAWDSNIFNREDVAVFLPARSLPCPQGYERNPQTPSECLSDGEESSPVTLVRPSLWLDSRGELGFFRAGVGATGRAVWQESDLNGIDSRARVDFNRKLTPRFSVLGGGSYIHYDDYQEIAGSAETVTNASGFPQTVDGAVFNAAQPSLTQEDGTLGLTYDLTPLTQLMLTGQLGRLNYDQERETLDSDYRDRDFGSGRLVLAHRLSSIDQLRLDFLYNGTVYEDLGRGQPESTIEQGRLEWRRSWSERWTTSAAVGVSYLISRDDNVPSVVGYSLLPENILDPNTPILENQFAQSGSSSTSDRSVGLVGEVGIERTFARSWLRLSYSRDTRSTGGSGQTDFDIDRFALDFKHRLASRVTLFLNADYSIYHSAADDLPPYPASTSLAVTPGGIATAPECLLGGTATAVGGIDLEGYFATPVYQCVGSTSEEKREYTTLTGRLEWQLRQRVTAFLSARYYHPITDRQLGDGPDVRVTDFHKYVFGIGIRYAWELDL